MLYTKIRLVGNTASGTSSIELPISDATTSDPYILKNVDGLGPPELTMTRQGAKPLNRELTVLVELNPDYSNDNTVEFLRKTLYSLLSPNHLDGAEFQFLDGASVVAKIPILGVKNLTPVIFTKEPQAQITFSCSSPYIEAIAVYDAMEDTLDEEYPVIINPGDAPSGFRMEIEFTSGITGWWIEDSVTDKKMEFDFTFLTGDILTIDTRPGSLRVDLTRSAVVSSLLGVFTTDSVWMKLYEGTNTLHTSDQVFDWVEFIYLPQWWGV